MSRNRTRLAALHVVAAIGTLGATIGGTAVLPSWPAAAAVGGAARQSAAPPVGVVRPAADYGIDIVRIPPSARKSGASLAPSVQTPPRPPVPPSPRGGLLRTLELPVRLGSQPDAGQKGWLGVEMEQIELPLALSLGLDNANGVLVLRTIAAGPAAQAGVQFGDIIVGISGAAVANMGDLRERIAAISPGNEAVLEVRRVTDEEGGFLRVLRGLAEGGNAHVMFRLGRMYATGSGTAVDEAEAVRWYRMGADAGNVNAMAALGEALLLGRGAPADPQEGLRLVRAAAGKDNAAAMNRLGHILLEGKLVTRDPPEAARLFTKAAEAGHLASMVDIGLMYGTNVGIQTDPSRAAMWFKQAAELGYSPGMVNLGWLYEHGTGVETDVAKAVMWYKRSVDLGNPVGMVNLGLLYAQGKGVDKNELAAVALYRRAAGLGNPMAMNNLAWMLQSGKGVDHRDPEEAADLMLQSLDKGNEFSRVAMTRYANAWSREFRQAMQRRLRDAGFYSGRIDGSFHASTIASLNAYINRTR
jgi:TPR repeat protein